MVEDPSGLCLKVRHSPASNFFKNAIRRQTHIRSPEGAITGRREVIRWRAASGCKLRKLRIEELEPVMASWTGGKT